jgi:UDPglucose 6-dehydrogenase
MSCDDIPMDILFSESGESCSTAPTSPSASPLFRPSDIDDLKLALPESTPPTDEHEQVQPVKNVCVVGAGYVGRHSIPY